MRDPRLQTLARNIVRYSVNVQPGERVLIDMVGDERELVKCFIEEVVAAGGQPFVHLVDSQVQRTFLRLSTTEQIKKWAEFDVRRMQDMQAYIAVRAGGNATELADVPRERMQDYMEYYVKPVHLELRVKHTKWCVLRYPNESMAQAAGQSTESFEDFYFNVCNLDYHKMSAAMDALAALLDRTDRVRITAPGTDLTFSIRDIPSVKCDGKFNIPDGEVFTAPVRTSVNGTISYNAPSVYMGTSFEQIRFTFQDGKIVEATANHTQRLNEILDTDEGARYIGEFSLGFNPHIKHPMKDILFDEKIDGSLHFTPGQAYEDADNGNRSAVHWDLVLIQRPEYGGGEVYFDDVLIRQDGRFVHPELLHLNPEHLAE
jgi:aminopeptidase